MSRRTRPVQPWIVYLLATVLLAIGSVSFARRIRATLPVAGVEWVQSAAGPVAMSVARGGAAAQAGVRPGDILVRVNGRPVRGAIEGGVLPWKAGRGGSVHLELRRGAKTVAAELRAGWLPIAPQAPVYGYLVLVGLAFLVSGAFIALKWPGVRGGRVYAWLAAALFGLLVFSPTGKADVLDWTVSWLDLVAAALAPALLLHLALVFSRRAWSPYRLALALVYAPAAGLLLLTAWLALGGQYRFDDPVLALQARDRLQMLFLGVSVPVAALLLVRASSKSSSGLHRSQMRWMQWGLVAGLLPFVLLYAIPWSLQASIPSWFELSVFPMLLVPAAFTAALARYRLHDLDVLLRRGLVEVTAVFCTAAVYALSQFLLRQEGAGISPLSNSAARYVGLAITAGAYLGLRHTCRVWVERVFYRERYSYRATLLDWARELNLETDLPSLSEHLRQRIQKTLAARDAALLLRRDENMFEDRSRPGGEGELELPAALVEQLERRPDVPVPDGGLAGAPWVRYLFGMRVKGRLRAVLAVAERPEPDAPFSTEDRALLSTLAAQVATAIEAARLLEEVRQGAEEVRRLQSRQERILESSGVGLLLVEEGRILAWNRALEAIYALPRREAIGRSLAEVFPLHLVRAIERCLDPARRGMKSPLYRYGLVNRAGQPVVVNITVSPASPEDSETLVISVDDVTERVNLEDQVLQQERLAALGMLAAGVAHEVNTPLTGISSYAQMLLEDLAPGDPRRDILEKIDSQTRRAAKITNSLLDLARPERAAFESVALNDTVREVLRLFEPQIRGRGIRIESNLSPDLPSVLGNKAELQQVLLNLLLNSRDALRAGGRISLATGCADGRVVLEVADDGEGISEEDLPRIFDPFFTTKGRGKGSGLGLSISYGIVREHSGKIEVESVPGEFTRFRVVLPTRRTATLVARKAAESGR